MTNKLYSVLVLGGAALSAACGSDDSKQSQNPLDSAGGQNDGTGGATAGQPGGGNTSSSGGRSPSGSGGSVSSGTGGHTQGGMPGTGGAHSTGGGPVNTGGVTGMGGAPETGGVQGTGGALPCCPAACWDLTKPPCACTGGVCCWLQPTHAGCERMC